jgi:ribosome recycling factor
MSDALRLRPARPTNDKFLREDGEEGSDMTTAEKPQIARYKDRMDKCVAALKDEFSSLRTGRASAGLLDQVVVDAYGTKSPITQVAAVSVPEPRMITVSVWDKAVVVSVEKAIRNAGLGLNPVVEGQNLRIPIPPLTEERRRELAKLAGKYAEQQKIAVRNVRRDAMDDLKKAEKDGTINQDEHKRLEVEVQKVTDEAVKRVDEVLKTKEHEIMQV